MAPRREIHAVKRVETFIVHGHHARNLSAFTKHAVKACEHAVTGKIEGKGKIEVHIRWRNRLADGCHACIEITWTSSSTPSVLFYAVTGTKPGKGEVLEGNGMRVGRGYHARVARQRAERKDKGYNR